MESTNNATTVSRDVFKKGFPHYLVSDIITYIVSGSVLLINATIVLIFILQHIRKPWKTRVSPTGVLVLNLLTSDALVGAMGIVITATFTEAGFTSTPYGCINRFAIRFFFRTGSHMALINVAIDRYIAITHTLHYRDIVTPERSIAMIAIGWAVPLAFTAYAYMGNGWWPGLFFCYELKSFTFFITYIRLPLHLIALLCVIIIQCRILFILRDHEKNKSPQYLRRYSQKSAKVLFWVSATYIVCWVPFDIVLVLLLFIRRPILKTILDVTVVFAYLSFIVNAFIFSFKTENIRKPVSDFCADVWNVVGWKRDAVKSSGENIASVTKTGPPKTSSLYSSSSNTTSLSILSQSINAVDVTVHI